MGRKRNNRKEKTKPSAEQSLNTVLIKQPPDNSTPNDNHKTVAKIPNNLWERIKSRIVSTEPKKPQRTVPWYESNLFWGPISFFVAIVLTVVAAMRHDLRWLLIVAWLFGILATWAILKGINFRQWILLPCAVVIAIGLLSLSAWLDPNTKQKELTNHLSSPDQQAIKTKDMFQVYPTPDDINKQLQLRSATPAMPTVSNLFDQRTPKKEKLTKQSIQAAITLYERYPSEWQQTVDKTSFITSIDKKVLRAVFEKGKNNYLLTPIIRNSNIGIPLTEPKIAIRMPINISFKQPTQWAYWTDGHHHYFYGRIYESVTSVPLGVNEHLILGFPKVGKYPIEYVISGIVGGNEVEVKGRFDLELIKEK